MSKAFKSTNLEPVYYVDPMKVIGGYTDENGVYKDYYSKTFTIKVELKNTETNLFELYQQRDLGVEFHTQVNTKVEKASLPLPLHGTAPGVINPQTPTSISTSFGT